MTEIAAGAYAEKKKKRNNRRSILTRDASETSESDGVDFKRYLNLAIEKSRNRVVKAHTKELQWLVTQMREDTGGELLIHGNIIRAVPKGDRLICLFLFLEAFNRLDSIFDEWIVTGKEEMSELDMKKYHSVDVALLHVFENFPIVSVQDERYSAAELLVMVKEIMKGSRDYSTRGVETLFGDVATETIGGEMQEYIQTIIVAAIEYQKLSVTVSADIDQLTPVDSFAFKYITIGRYLEIGYALANGLAGRFKTPKEYLEEIRLARRFGMLVQIDDDMDDIADDISKGNANPMAAILANSRVPDIIYTVLNDGENIAQRYEILKREDPESAQAINRLFRIAVGVNIDEAQAYFARKGLGTAAFLEKS